MLISHCRGLGTLSIAVNFISHSDISGEVNILFSLCTLNALALWLNLIRFVQVKLYPRDISETSFLNLEYMQVTIPNRISKYISRCVLMCS